MLLNQRRPRRGNPNLICSPKCHGAIVAPTTLHRDLLLQTSLDQHVRSIQAFDADSNRQDILLVLDRDDGRFVVGIIESPLQAQRRRSSTLALFGLPFIGISAEEIRQEPRLGNARRVRVHSNDDPSLRRREGILDTLSGLGPLTIGELERLTRLPDVLPTVCALACADLAEIDIVSGPLGRGTLVRGRRSSPSTRYLPAVPPGYGSTAPRRKLAFDPQADSPLT